VARYILIATVVGSPEGGAYTIFGRGTCIADSDANRLAGDVVWPALCRAPNSTNMRPLDEAASAAMGGIPIMTLAELATSSIGGP
jgi:hypothetical protein